MDWFTHRSRNPSCICEANGGTIKTMKDLKLEDANVKRFEIPFNSENKWMISIHGGGNGPATLIMKGAPDRVLQYCNAYKDGGVADKIDREMNALMGQARRVLCIAK